MKMYNVVNIISGEFYSRAIPAQKAQKLMADLKADRKMLEDARINGTEWADDIDIIFAGYQK